MIKKYYPIISLFLIFLGIIVYFTINQKKYSSLQYINFSDKENYQIKEIYIQDQNNYKALYQNGETLLRINVISHLERTEAETKIKGEIAQLKSLFQKRISPYPGEISDQIDCGAELKPEIKQATTNTNITYFTTYLNSRMVTENCLNDQIDFQSLNIVFYCQEKKNYYYLEFIQDYKDNINIEKLLSSISCS